MQLAADAATKGGTAQGAFAMKEPLDDSAHGAMAWFDFFFRVPVLGGF